MKIEIETIPHELQRYPTIGDYYYTIDSPRDPGHVFELKIKVSETGDWKYDALVALHEFVEVLLCRDRGIAEPDIKAFDEAFEANRPPGDVDSEPGDDPKAPYGKEHRFAENLERLFAAELGVNWAQYDADLCKIWHPQPTSETK